MIHQGLVKSIFVIALMFIFGNVLSCESLGSSEISENTEKIFSCEMQMLKTCYSNIGDAELLITVVNISDKIQTLNYPYDEESWWPQFVWVFHNAIRLKSKPDHDYMFKPSKLNPMEKISLMVNLNRFYSDTIGDGEGLYYVYWKCPASVNRTDNAHTTFLVSKDCEPEENDHVMDEHFQDKLFKEILRDPNNPKILKYLHSKTGILDDQDILFQIINSTIDLGIRRSCALQLTKVKRSEEIVSFVKEKLKNEIDVPTRDLYFNILFDGD